MPHPVPKSPIKQTVSRNIAPRVIIILKAENNTANQYQYSGNEKLKI